MGLKGANGIHSRVWKESRRKMIQKIADFSSKGVDIFLVQHP